MLFYQIHCKLRKIFNPCSSANAKKWEIELNSLKTTNARLTAALQESTANVEEWKKQLQTYKEENTRMKHKIVELEAGGSKGLIVLLV